MVIELNSREKELLVYELEKTIIPELRCEVASGMRKELRDELKKDEVALKGILEKLKAAA